MNAKRTRTFLRGAFAALMLSAVFAGSAVAAPIWNFESKELSGTETVVGGAEDSFMTIPTLKTDCENFLYKIAIQNSAGTGTGSINELPLYECETDAEACGVKSIGAEKLPWAATLKTVSTTHYIYVSGVQVGVVYSGEECAMGGILVKVTGTASGSINNGTETATFNASTFSATGAKLTSMGQSVEWQGLFPTEAFEWHREQALSVS